MQDIKVKPKILNESTELDKKMFHYILDKNYIEECEPELFSESNKDVYKIYKVIYEYFIEYNSKPSSSIIHDYDFSIDIKLIEALFKYKATFQQDYDSNKEYYDNYFEDWWQYKKARLEVLSDIDSLRSYDNIKAAKEYNSKKGIESPLIKQEEDIEEENPLNETDFIPDEVYNNLPDFLKNECSYFTGRERDVFFTSDLGVLSALFKNVQGLYDRKPVYPNLYIFIAAPTANGKGIINYAKNTLEEFNKREKEINEQKRKGFSEEELKKMNISDKRLLIPGNASTASYIDELKNNGGVGLTIETEADTITNNKKQDWGDYDTCLRIGFHHEHISLVRKNGRIEIETPKISFVTSGTMKQLLNFIPSTENGLYSRYIYYTYQQKPLFRNPWETDDNYEDIFKKFGKELLEIYDFYDRYDSDNKTINYTFSLTDKQKEKFMKKFPLDLNDTIAHANGNDINASFYRLGLITYKFAMILSILRNYDKRKDNIFDGIHNNIICEDIDFEIALKLFDVYLKHMKLIYENMGGKDEVKFKQNSTEQMFNELPSIFTRHELVNVGEKFGIHSKLERGNRNIDRILKKWREAGKIKKDKHNFIKINTENDK